MGVVIQNVAYIQRLHIHGIHATNVTPENQRLRRVAIACRVHMATDTFQLAGSMHLEGVNCVQLANIQI